MQIKPTVIDSSRSLYNTWQFCLELLLFWLFIPFLTPNNYATYSRENTGTQSLFRSSKGSNYDPNVT